MLAGSVFFIRSWTSVIVSYRPQIGTACGGDITGAAAPVRRRQSPSRALFLSCLLTDSILAIAFLCTLGLARKAPRARTMEMGTKPAGTFDDAHVTAPCDNFGFLPPFRERARLVARKRVPPFVLGMRVILVTHIRSARARSDICASGFYGWNLEVNLSRKAASSRSAF